MGPVEPSRVLVTTATENSFVAPVAFRQRFWGQLSCWNIILRDAVTLLASYPLQSIQVAVWLSGNALVSIDEVTLRRARLVCGWVAV